MKERNPNRLKVAAPLAKGHQTPGDTLKGGHRTRRRWEWFCYGKCQEFVEINCDFEQNVCGQCHQPTIGRRPVDVPTEETTREELQERRHAASVQAMRDRAKAHEWFEEMRKAAA